MKINLLFIKKGRHARFIVSVLEAGSRPSFLQGEGWIARVGRKVHEIYEKLKDRIDYQEHVCSSLRHATEIRVLHPESISKEEAKESFQEFLVFRAKKHTIWLVIDTVLALMGSLLTPIPGPNLFFFYPAARALSHYFARQGSKKARQVQVLCYKAESKLDKLTHNLENLNSASAEIGELEERYNFKNIRLLLERL